MVNFQSPCRIRKWNTEKNKHEILLWIGIHSPIATLAESSIGENINDWYFTSILITSPFIENIATTLLKIIVWIIVSVRKLLLMIIVRENDVFEIWNLPKYYHKNRECLNFQYLPIIAAFQDIVISKFNPEAEWAVG